MEIGNLNIEFKEFEPFEVLPFMPFFQRYMNVVLNVRTDLRKEIDKKAAVLAKKPDDENAIEEYDRLTNLLNSEVETATIKMFKNFNSFEWKELKGFIVSHIKSWNLEIKDDKGEFVEAPVDVKGFDKIPIMLIPGILINVALLIVDNGSEINFSIAKSEKQEKNTSSPHKGKGKTA